MLFVVPGGAAIRVVSTTLRLVRAAKVARILRMNGLQGAAAEKLVEKKFLEEGFELVGRRVSVNTSQGRRVVDRIFKDSAGRYFNVEVKSGGAVRSADQVIKIALSLLRVDVSSARMRGNSEDA
jgi:hypothetical protein